MPSNKTPTDPDHQPFNQRPKVWMGMSVQSDIGTIKDNQTHFLENTRFTIDGYRERGGQTKGTTDEIPETVNSIFEAGDIGAASAVSSALAPGIYIGGGGGGAELVPPLWGTGALHVYRDDDADDTGSFLPGESYSMYENVFPIDGSFGGGGVGSRASAIVSDGSKAYFAGAPPGGGIVDETIGIFSVLPGEPVAPAVRVSEIQLSLTAPGPGNNALATGLVENSPSEWYIGLAGSSVNLPSSEAYSGRVYTWDGTGAAPVIEDSAPDPTPPAIVPAYGRNFVRVYKFGSEIFALYNNNNLLRRRTSGGVWGNITLPSPYVYGAPPFAGSEANFHPYCACEYNGALYIGGMTETNGVTGYQALIMKWDGTLNPAHFVSYTDLGLTAPSPSVNKLFISSMVVLDGILYFGFADGSPLPATFPLAVPRAAIIGSFDGFTWTNIVKNMQTQFTTADHAGIAHLGAYNGKLFAFLNTHISLFGPTGYLVPDGIYFSPGTTVAGTWSRTLNNIPFFRWDQTAISSNAGHGGMGLVFPANT
jgi:hypothetical protein